MEVALWLAVGFVASAALIKFAHHQSFKTRLNLLGSALIIASLIYVGFAALNSNFIWMGIELLGVLVYATFFYLAKRYGLLLLAFGWALHPVWDTVLHLFGAGASFAPQWYAIMCISFDITVAAYLVVQARTYSTVKRHT